MKSNRKVVWLTSLCLVLSAFLFTTSCDATTSSSESGVASSSTISSEIVSADTSSEVISSSSSSVTKTLEEEIIEIATIAAESFSYYQSISPGVANYHVGENEIEGQCGDYAVKFAMLWNDLHPDNPARLVVANQDHVADSGSYNVIGLREEFDATDYPYEVSSWYAFEWPGGRYDGLVFGLYHPVVGFVELELAELYTVTEHFGVDMTDPAQIHVWAKVGDIAVDPCYADIFNTPMIGVDVTTEIVPVV